MKSILVLPTCFDCPGQDRGYGIVPIIHDCGGRQTQNGQSPFRKPAVALLIPHRRIPSCMRFAVDLDHQPRLMAVKVCHIGTGRVLTAKFQTLRPLPQYLPEQDFRLRHRLAQLPCPVRLPLQHIILPWKGRWLAKPDGGVSRS